MRGLTAFLGSLAITVRLNHALFVRNANSYALRLHSARMLSRRLRQEVQHGPYSAAEVSVAPWPFSLGSIGAEVATLLDRLIPPTRHLGSRVGAGSKPWSSWFSDPEREMGKLLRHGRGLS